MLDGRFSSTFSAVLLLLGLICMSESADLEEVIPICWVASESGFGLAECFTDRRECLEVDLRTLVVVVECESGLGLTASSGEGLSDDTRGWLDLDRRALVACEDVSFSFDASDRRRCADWDREGAIGLLDRLALALLRCLLTDLGRLLPVDESRSLTSL